MLGDADGDALGDAEGQALVTPQEMHSARPREPEWPSGRSVHVARTSIVTDEGSSKEGPRGLIYIDCYSVSSASRAAFM